METPDASSKHGGGEKTETLHFVAVHQRFRNQKARLPGKE
jgi:hypothetical protein